MLMFTAGMMRLDRIRRRKKEEWFFRRSRHRTDNRRKQTETKKQKRGRPKDTLEQTATKDLKRLG